MVPQWEAKLNCYQLHDDKEKREVLYRRIHLVYQINLDYLPTCQY